MTVTTLIGKLKQLERPISQDARASLLTDLRAQPTEMDSVRPTSPDFWTRGGVYLHSMQDTLFVHGVFAENMGGLEYVRPCHACFVKDLDYYLWHFPQGETEMRKIFDAVFRVGTSAPWENDKELVLGLHRIYWTLDTEVIRPWVELG